MSLADLGFCFVADQRGEIDGNKTTHVDAFSQPAEHVGSNPTASTVKSGGLHTIQLYGVEVFVAQFMD